jgi:hypothetical protein
MNLIPLTEQMNTLNMGYEEHNKDKDITLTLHGQFEANMYIEQRKNPKNRCKQNLQ